MRGSSIDRHDRRRRCARLNVFREKAEGEAGSPVWGGRLSVESLRTSLLCPQEDELWV